MIMLGSTCSPCCGCDQAGLNSVLAALTPRVTISGSWPIPADISSRCQRTNRSASRAILENFVGIYVKGSLDRSPAPWVGNSTYWRGYKPYSGEMIGTHALMLYPPGSSDGVYAFRRDYGDGRSVEVVFTNAGATAPNPGLVPRAAKWSQGNPCYVGITIRLTWEQPLYYTSAPVPASFTLSTFSSAGGTFTVAISDQADLFPASNWFYTEYNNSELTTTRRYMAGTLPGVAPGFVRIAGEEPVKNASIESFGLPTIADEFFVPLPLRNNHNPFPAMAAGEFWNNSGGFSMQTMERSGLWNPVHLQTVPWNAPEGNQITKPSLSFTGGFNKVIEISAANAGVFSSRSIAFDASVSLSLT